MKHFAALILFVAVFTVLAGAQEPKPIRPASSYKISGITFKSPDQPGWTVYRTGDSEILFEKTGKDERMKVSVTIFKVSPWFATEIEGQRALEALKNAQVDTPQRDSLHYYYVRFNNMACVQYDGNLVLAPAATPGKFEHNNFKGYLCPHPKTKGLAVQLEFSNHSDTKGFNPAFNDLMDQFFQTAKFPKLAAN